MRYSCVVLSKMCSRMPVPSERQFPARSNCSIPRFSENGGRAIPVKATPARKSAASCVSGRIHSSFPMQTGTARKKSQHTSRRSRRYTICAVDDATAPMTYGKTSSPKSICRCFFAVDSHTGYSRVTCRKYSNHNNQTHTAVCKQRSNTTPRNTVFAGKGGNVQ